MNLTQEIIKQVSDLMRQNGFKRRKKVFLKKGNDIIYNVEFDAPSGILYTTFYIMPLYIPAEDRYCCYGNRLNTYSLPLLKRDSSAVEISNWLTSFTRVMEVTVFPFFEEINSPDTLVSWIENNPSTIREYFFCSPFLLNRLLMYSYLYLCDIIKLRNIIPDCVSTLNQCSYLLDGVKNSYLSEINTVSKLVNSSDNMLQGYMAEIICNMTQKLL